MSHSTHNDFAEGFLASALYEDGRFAEAALHAERARMLNPHNDQALVMLAGLSERKGNLDKAISLYRSALALRPDNPLVQCQLAFLELNRGRFDQARVLMTPALRADPTLVQRSLEIGRIALRHGDTASALFLFQLVLDDEPDNAEAQGGLGLSLFARNDPRAAIVHLRAAVKRMPTIADTQLALAYCAQRLGYSDEASTALSAAETAAPANPVILSRAADFHARLNQFAAAIHLYRQVLALAPADVNAHIALGFLLLHEGDRAGALAQWHRALELDPNLPGLRDEFRRVAP